MRQLIRINRAVIVEGKYDKIRLSNILDATIITTDGFGIFKNTEKRELIRLLAEKCGIVIITDSDHAGQMIRRHICNFVKSDNVINIYLPEIKGKEKRKLKPGAEGLLGVEGISDEIITEALERAGVTSSRSQTPQRPVQKTDLYNFGISGREDSAAKRADFCRNIGLPDLPSNTLLDAINTIYTYDEFISEVNRWKQDETEN